ncbi:MAG: cell division protein FtsA, partial [Candidatus Nealsonbacteria bacterium]
HLITGLDIGTSAIKALVAQKSSNTELEVMSQISEPAAGTRKGVVIDTEVVSNILQNILERAKTETGARINSVYLNVGGSHIFSTSSHGLVSVSRADQKISEEDVNRVLQAAQTFSLPSNKEIFDVLPREFIVDGEKGIKEALGMQGVRLEAEVLVLGGFSPYLKNLTQAVLNSDLQILDMIPSPISSARACLSPRQKELGVAILDIGAGTSGLAVFEEGDLIHLAIFPIGSGNITNDIAIGLKTDIDVAERIKIEHGSCLLSSTKAARKKEKIEIGEPEPLVFSQKQLVNIIEARVSEIFGEVNKELKKISREKLLPAGVVLTGGGSKLPKIVELAKKELKLPCRLGKPQGFLDFEKDPSLATVCGLVLEGADLETERSPSILRRTNLLSKLKRIFKIFIP